MFCRLTLLLIVGYLLGACSFDNKERVENTFTFGCFVEDYPDAESSLYSLPFQPGSSFTVVRGNCAQFGHNQNEFGNLSYTYDFAMPVGSEVLAVRSGIVVKVVDQFSNGNLTPNEANYIAIDHRDGTVAQYVHLANASIPFAEGAIVNQGDLIALSGDTGVTSAPKLHLEVIDSPLTECVVNADTANCNSVPLTFQERFTTGRTFGGRSRIHGFWNSRLVISDQKLSPDYYLSAERSITKNDLFD